LVTDERLYDFAGRVVRSGATGTNGDEVSDVFNTESSGAALRQLGMAAEYRIDAYDQGRRIREKVIDLSGNEQDDIYFEDGLGGGYDRAGNLKGYTVVSSGGEKNVYKTEYRLGAGYQEQKVTATRGNIQGITTSTYDASGNRITIEDTGVTTGTRRLFYDADGRVLQKAESTAATVLTPKITRNLIVNGEQLGDNSVESAGNLANPYQSVSATALSNAPTVYTVRAATETYQSIAKLVYGDSNLHFIIADANGARTLAVGDIIKIPPRTNTLFNDANSFKPYDPSELIGGTSPNLPPPQNDAGCGTFGRIISTVVAVVVAVAVATITQDPTLTLTAFEKTAVLATAAAAGNAAGQIVGNVTGVQNGFSFKSVALSALTGGLAPAPVAGEFLSNFANAALANAEAQGLAVITGLQDSFDFRSVAAAGVGASIGQSVGESLAGRNPAFAGFGKVGGQFARDLVRGFATSTATSIVRSGKVSVGQIASDVFGTALGSAFANKIVPAQLTINQRVQINAGRGPLNSEQANVFAAEDRAQSLKNFTGENLLTELLNGEALREIRKSTNNPTQLEQGGNTPARFVGGGPENLNTIQGKGKDFVTVKYFGEFPEPQRLEVTLTRGIEDRIDQALEDFQKSFQDTLIADVDNAAVESNNFGRGLAAITYLPRKIIGNVGAGIIGLPRLVFNGTLLANIVTAAGNPVKTFNSARSEFSKLPIQDKIVTAVELALPFKGKLTQLGERLPGVGNVALGFSRADGVTFTPPSGVRFGFTVNDLPPAIKAGPFANQTGSIASVRFGALDAKPAAPSTNLVRNATERVSPFNIRFTQDTVSPNFSNGGTISEAVAKLRRGVLTADDFPIIRVVERDGKLFSLDNRRLLTFQTANIESIQIKRLSLQDPDILNEFSRKFRPIENGEKIVVVQKTDRAAARRILREFNKND
jgi:hypothetical protein